MVRRSRSPKGGKPLKEFKRDIMKSLKEEKKIAEIHEASKVAGRYGSAIDSILSGTAEPVKVKIAQQNNVVKISIEAKDKQKQSKGLIDLKPFFKKNSEPRYDPKNHHRIIGWYKVVPMRIKTYKNSESNEKSNEMSKRMYSKALRDAPMGNFYSDYLYDGRETRLSKVKELNYVPKSNSITKLKDNKTNNQTRYIAFRVVSDQSPANSWLLNRSSVKSKKRANSEIMKIVALMKKAQ